MAQDLRRKTTPYAQSPQNSPGSRSSRTQASPNSQHLQGGASSWSPNNSSSKLKNHDDHGSHHKKSVLMKVKEKVRKLKKSLSMKKRRDSNEFHSPYSTPPAGPRFEDDKKDEPKYFSSLVHESEVAPGPDKLAAKGPSQEANSVSSEKHNRKNNIDPKKNEHQNTNTTTADSSPDNTDSGLTISTSGDTGVGTHDSGTPKSNSGKKENGQSPRNNKGISVKEYLMQKFEPGEDERALSQAITQTISPKCRKMREAMSSFLRTEEPSALSQNVSASSDSSQDVAASSSTEPPELNSSLSNGLSLPSHGLNSSLSNASNLSLMSSSTAASWQNQNDSNLNSDEVVKDKNRQKMPQAN